MKQSDLDALKNWLSRLRVLDAQNTDLIDDAIYQCERNTYLAKKRLEALADNLRRANHPNEAEGVERYL